jgi:chromosome segregation ATPase
MSTREAYRDKLAAQIEEQRAKIDLMKARAKQALADGKIDASQEIDVAEQKLDAAKAKLHELGSASDEAWESLKGGCEEAWSSFKEAWGKAVDKFK